MIIRLFYHCKIICSIHNVYSFHNINTRMSSEHKYRRITYYMAVTNGARCHPSGWVRTQPWCHAGHDPCQPLLYLKAKRNHQHHGKWRQWPLIGGLYLSFGGQTLEAEAGGGQYLKSFCWITLLLTATNGH